MLYKIAAKKKRKSKKLSPAKLERDARRRVRDSFLLELLDYGNTSSIKSYGAVQGAKHKAEFAGAAFGPVGVNGAIARKTGISTFWPTVTESAKLYGGYGAVAGALYGLAHGLRSGRVTLPEVALGAAFGGGVGALVGGAGNAILYGLGYGAGR